MDHDTPDPTWWQKLEGNALGLALDEGLRWVNRSQMPKKLLSYVPGIAQQIAQDAFSGTVNHLTGGIPLDGSKDAQGSRMALDALAPAGIAAGAAPARAAALGAKATPAGYALGFKSALMDSLSRLSDADKVGIDTLKKGGVKKAEIEARLPGIVIDDGYTAGQLREIAEQNPIELKEARYGGREPDPTFKEIDRVDYDDGRYDLDYEDMDSGKTYIISMDPDAGNAYVQGPGGEFIEVDAPMNNQTLDDAKDAMRLYAERLGTSDDVSGPAEYSNWSLDPDNPTYRESVVYMPQPTQSMDDISRQSQLSNRLNRGDDLTNEELLELQSLTRKYELGEGYHSGHWDEPNIAFHTRTQEMPAWTGNDFENSTNVLNIDEVQSDWGQSIRDNGGVRDEAKIAALTEEVGQLKKIVNGTEALDWSIDVNDWAKSVGLNMGDGSVYALRNNLERLSSRQDKVGQKAKEFIERNPAKEALLRLDLAIPELQSASSAVTGHPLVNNPKTFTTAAIRKLLMDAANNEGVEGITVTPGHIHQRRYGSDGAGHIKSYDEIIPKLIDKELKRHGVRRQQSMVTLPDSRSSEIFNYWRLTPEAREAIKRGLPLFNSAAPAAGLAAYNQSNALGGF